MTHIRRIATSHWKSAAAAALFFALPATAQASREMCPTIEDHRVFDAFTQKIAQAGTTEEAQALALSKIDLGRRAIDRASHILPGRGAGLAEASAKLDRLEAGVRAGQSPAQVAAPFQNLAATGDGCNYTTTEIVVTVIGFVLGILPGILFLILFC